MSDIPKFTIRGNLLIDYPKPKNWDKNARVLMEHITEVNMLNVWENETFMGKVGWVVKALFRKRF